MTQQYKYSQQLSRSNFTLGHEQTGSTYKPGSCRVYTDHCHLVPSCTHCKYKALLSAFENPNLGIKSLKNQAQRNEKDEKQMKPTNFTFGNDGLNHTTTYKDFTSVSELSPAGERAKTMAPPSDAQVLPDDESVKMPQRSSVRNDFTYFGPQINTLMYSDRVKDFSCIQDQNEQDSVGVSLLGKRRKMLTQSMIDYRHPLDRVSGDIKGLMVQQISPFVRQNSIWSVNSGDKNIKSTEAGQNYIWPRSRGMYKRFLRGGSNDKIR